MKNVKSSLRTTIAVGSAVGFLGGWALLAHAPKPAPAFSQTPSSAPAAAAVEVLPTLAPLPPMGELVTSSQNFQLAPSFTQTRAFRPRFRTGGS
jgi:hypothetical protein